MPASQAPTPAPKGDDVQSADAKARGSVFKFTDKHKAYLESYLDVFLAVCAHLDNTGSGPRKVKGNKGSKKDWVESQVIPGFVTEFQLAGSGGPSLGDLSLKIYQWYINQHKDRQSGEVAKPERKGRKPKAPSVAAIFAQEHSDKIKALAREKGHASSGEYLKNYHLAKMEMYNQLGHEDQLAYHTRADASKEALKEKPEESVVFENQKFIVDHTGEALRSLTGFNWGGHGQVVYWVVGAFLNQNDGWKTFNVTVPPRGIKMESFTSKIPEKIYNDDIRAPFLSHIKASIKTTTDRTKATAAGITFDKEGFPILLVVDTDALPPKAVGHMLNQFLICIWEFVLPRAYSHVPVPWESLHTIADGVTSSLDLRSISMRHLYDIYDTIHKKQKQGKHGIDLNPTEDFLKALIDADSQTDDGDIDEIPDPQKVTQTSLKSGGDVDHPKGYDSEGNTKLQSPKPPSNNGKPAKVFDVVPIGPVARFLNNEVPQPVEGQSKGQDLEDGEEWGGPGDYDDEEWFGTGIGADDQVDVEPCIESDESDGVALAVGADNEVDVELDIERSDVASTDGLELGIGGGGIAHSDNRGEGIDVDDGGSTLNNAIAGSDSTHDGEGGPGQAEDEPKAGGKRKSESTEQPPWQRRKRLSASEVASRPRRSSRQRSAGADQHSNPNLATSKFLAGTGAWKRWAYMNEPPKHASAPYPSTHHTKRQ